MAFTDGVRGWSPGRLTLAGEHVDYAGGVVVAVATDLGIEIEVRASRDEMYRISSAGRTIERASTDPAGDIGDRVLGAVEALRRRGFAIPAIEAAVIAASLPEAAGMASSAAITCATLVALLRGVGASLTVRELVDCALVAERDVVGVPCGVLDPLAIVNARADAALVIDCSSGMTRSVQWPWDDITLIVCDTGTTHDVGGLEYQRRRQDAEQVLAAWGRESLVGVQADDVDQLPENLRGRARHLVSETGRAQAAEVALRVSDVASLGRLMSESHASLRDDYEVSTPLLDTVVAAAGAVNGCWGARLVGAGFGGSVVALCNDESADACAAAMAQAIGATDQRRIWRMRPAGGLAMINSDVVVGERLSDPR